MKELNLNTKTVENNIPEQQKNFKDKKYVVYKHTCPNKKIYIGITCVGIKQRWSNGYGYKNQKFFTKAIVKFGWENIIHEIVSEDLSYNDALTLENKLISQYKSNNSKFGYNCALNNLDNLDAKKIDFCIKIDKAYIEILKEYPKLLLLLLNLFILQNGFNTILSNINTITELCGYKPNTSTNGACDNFKQLISVLLNNKILTKVNNEFLKTSITNDFNKISNNDLFNLKFINPNQFINIKSNFVSLEYSTINKIVKYTIITNKNTNSVNSSNLVNIYTVIKYYIFNSDSNTNNLKYTKTSVEEFSAILGISENTIVKNIKILEELELIYVYRFDRSSCIITNAYSLELYDIEDIKQDIIMNKSIKVS